MDSLEMKYANFEIFILSEMHALTNICVGNINGRYNEWTSMGITIGKNGVCDMRNKYYKKSTPVILDKTGLHVRNSGLSTLEELLDEAKSTDVTLRYKATQDHEIVIENTKYDTIFYKGTLVRVVLQKDNFTSRRIDAIVNLLEKLPIEVDKLDFTRAHEHSRILESVAEIRLRNAPQPLIVPPNHERTIKFMITTLSDYITNGTLNIPIDDYKIAMREILAVVHNTK
jgi:hypothetical protein